MEKAQHGLDFFDSLRLPHGGSLWRNMQVPGENLVLGKLSGLTLPLAQDIAQHGQLHQKGQRPRYQIG